MMCQWFECIVKSVLLELIRLKDLEKILKDGKRYTRTLTRGSKSF